MNHLKFFVTSLIISVLIFPIIALAQDEGTIDIFSQVLQGSIVNIWVNFLGLPNDWLRGNLFVFNFLIPFIAIYVVTLGLLRELRIYRRQPNIEYVLAFVIAFSTLPTRIFVSFVALSLGVLGILSYVVFLILFGLGTFLFMRGRISGSIDERKAFSQIYRNLHAEQDHLLQERSDIQRARTVVHDEYNQGKYGKNLTKARKKYEDELAKLDQKMLNVAAQEKAISDRVNEFKKSADIN